MMTSTGSFASRVAKRVDDATVPLAPLIACALA
jgi:hypothetical protein